MDASHSEESFRRCLRNLPKGLIATYQRILEKLAQKPERQQILTRNILKWILCARRPLMLEELREAVSIEPGSLSLDRSKIPAETDGNRFLHCCENLVQYCHDDGEITITHHSVAQFLEEYVVTRRLSEIFVGDMCTTYLNFSDFQSQVIPAHEAHTIKRDVENRSTFIEIPRILGIAGGVYDFLVGLYSRRAPRAIPEVDYAQLWRKYQRKRPSPWFEQHFPLLAYVRDHWVSHTRCFENYRDSCAKVRWNRFRDLVLSKAIIFNFRPWDGDQSSSVLTNLPIFMYAVRNAHSPLVRLLSESGSLNPFVEVICGGDSTMIPFAETLITQDDSDILDLLFRDDPNISDKEKMLLHTLRQGHHGFLKKLLDQSKRRQRPSSPKELIETEFDSVHFGEEFRRNDGKNSRFRALHWAI